MNPAPKRELQRRSPATAGSDVRAKVESLGTALAARLSALLASLPRRSVGPQRLGEALGISELY